VVVVVVVEVLVVDVVVVDVVEVLDVDVDVDVDGSVVAEVVAGGSIVEMTTDVGAAVDSRPSPCTVDVHAGSARTAIVRSTIARRSTTQRR